MKMVVDCPPGAEVDVSFGLATDLKFVPPPKGTPLIFRSFLFNSEDALQLLDTCAGKTSLQVRILRSIQQRTMLSVTHDGSAF